MSALAVALAWLPGAALGADEAPVDASPKGPLLHPDGPGRYRVRAAVGALLDILPRKVAESEARTIPQLTAALRVGLPAGLSADVRAKAVYVSNQVELGLGWSFRRGDLSVGALFHGGVWFGALGFEGFDAFGWGGVVEPGFALGYSLERTHIALTSEAIVTFAQHTRLGDAETVGKQRVSLAGLANTLTVEVPIGPTMAVYGGFGILWTLPDYQAWIAFSDSTTHYAYPRFIAGITF